MIPALVYGLALANAALAAVLTAPGPGPPAARPGGRQRHRTRASGTVPAPGSGPPAGRGWAPCAGGAAAGALAAGLLLGPAAAPWGGFAGWLAVQEIRYSRCEQAQLRMADRFRDFLEGVAGCLRSGRSLAQALEQAWRDLLRVPGRAEDPLARELARLLEEIRLGAPLDAAVAALARRVPLEEAGLFAGAVTVCRVHGGNLVEVLYTLIRLNTDRSQARREAQVQTAQRRLEGLIICLLPVIMLALLAVAAPGYVAPLLETAAGQVAVGGGLFLVLAAHLLIRRMARIEY